MDAHHYLIAARTDATYASTPACVLSTTCGVLGTLVNDFDA